MVKKIVTRIQKIRLGAVWDFTHQNLDLSFEDMVTALKNLNYKCPYCGEKIYLESGWSEFSVGFVIDHVIAKSKGGTNKRSNLLPCCANCNSSKGPKSLEEWSKPYHHKFPEGVTVTSIKKMMKKLYVINTHPRVAIR